MSLFLWCLITRTNPRINPYPLDKKAIVLSSGYSNGTSCQEPGFLKHPRILIGVNFLPTIFFFFFLLRIFLHRDEHNSVGGGLVSIEKIKKKKQQG